MRVSDRRKRVRSIKGWARLNVQRQPDPMQAIDASQYSCTAQERERSRMGEWTDLLLLVAVLNGDVGSSGGGSGGSQRRLLGVRLATALLRLLGDNGGGRRDALFLLVIVLVGKVLVLLLAGDLVPGLMADGNASALPSAVYRDMGSGKPHLLLGFGHALPDEADLLEDLGVRQVAVLLAEVFADRVLVLDVGRRRAFRRERVLGLFLLARSTTALLRVTVLLRHIERVDQCVWRLRGRSSSSGGDNRSKEGSGRQETHEGSAGLCEVADAAKHVGEQGEDVGRVFGLVYGGGILADGLVGLGLHLAEVLERRAELLQGLDELFVRRRA